MKNPAHNVHAAGPACSLNSKLLGLLTILLAQAPMFQLCAQPLLAYDQPITGSITKAAQRDSYVFTATNGEEMAVGVLRNSGNMYPEIEIRGPGDVLLGQSHDISWAQINPFTCTNGGQYTVWVYDYYSTGSGTYTIVRQRRNDSSPVALGYDQPITSSITNMLKADAYSFTATNGEEMALGVLVKSGNMYPEIEIRGPGNVLLAQSHDISWAQINPFTCTNGGQYTVWVYDYNSTGSGTYTIVRQRRNDFSPVALGYDQPVTGAITNMLKADAYSFTATNGEEMAVGVLVKSGNMYPAIQILGPGGVLLAQSGRSSWVQINPFTCTNGGEFTLWVYDYNSTGSGTYTIVRQRRNDSSPVALGYDQPITSSITNMLKADAYSFTATNGEEMALGVLVKSGNMYPAIELLGPGGVLLAQSGRSSWVQINPFTCTNGGQFTVWVYDYNSTGSGTYTIVRQRRNCFPDIVPIACQTITRTITNLLKVDPFSLSAKAGDEWVIEVQKVSGSLYPAIEIRDPSDVLIASNQSSASVEINPLTCTNVGVYSIWVYDYYGTGTGTYYLSAALNVPGPPVIISQPQGQTNYVGSTVNFSVGAEGSCSSSLPLSYQWRCYGTNLINGGRVSGVTNTTLTISNLQANDAGPYTVVVSNSGGAVDQQPSVVGGAHRDQHGDLRNGERERVAGSAG